MDSQEGRSCEEISPYRVLPKHPDLDQLKRQAKNCWTQFVPANQTPSQKPPRDILALTYRNSPSRCSTCARQGARFHSGPGSKPT